MHRGLSVCLIFDGIQYYNTAYIASAVCDPRNWQVGSLQRQVAFFVLSDSKIVIVVWWGS